MSHLITTASDEAVSFVTLGLRAELLRALDAAGYTHPTPIQAEAIPAILEGRDVLAAAQTGTGKTAGFTLPILHRLMAGQPAPHSQERSRAIAQSVRDQGDGSRVVRAEAGKDSPSRRNGPKGGRQNPGGNGARRPIRVLILTPTRELAAQVATSVQTYGRYLPLASTAIFGGVSMNPQRDALGRGVDILVATPGRLLDHMQQGTLDLSKVEILVLDEADRMLDMGFIRDIRRILPLIPNGGQRLLFSATFSEEIKKLADGLLKSPVKIEVVRPDEEKPLIQQTVCFVKQEQKRDFLLHLIESEKMAQVLVFTRTKHGADRLTRHLSLGGVSAVAIHSNRSQAQRTQALAEFKSGRVRVLVATDIAARGLDIPQLPHVINFEIPNAPEDYVHRIGRTGRAGNIGEAISLVSPEERKFLVAIERLTGKPVERRPVSGFVPPKSPEHSVQVEEPSLLVRQESETEEQPVVAESRRAARPPKPKFELTYPGRNTRPTTIIRRTPRHKRKPTMPVA